MAENLILAWKIIDYQSGRRFPPATSVRGNAMTATSPTTGLTTRNPLVVSFSQLRERIAQLGAIERFIARVPFQAHREVVNFRSSSSGNDASSLSIRSRCAHQRLSRFKSLRNDQGRDKSSPLRLATVRQ